MKSKLFFLFFLCLTVSQAQDFTNWTIGVHFAPGFYWKYNKLEFNHPGIIAVKPQFPNTINLGVDVYRNFNDKWQFKTGIEYSKNNQKFISSDAANIDQNTGEYYNYTFNQKVYANIYYVSMPFQVKYSIYNNKIKGWSVFTEQGFRISYLIDYYQKLTSYKVYFGVTNEINYTHTSYYCGNNTNDGGFFKTNCEYAKFNLGITGSFGIDKKVSDRFNISGSFRYDYDINNVDNPDRYYNTTAYMGMIPEINKKDRKASHNIRVLFELGIKYNFN